MTQINTPYPATAYLTGFLRSRGISVAQEDAGLELFLSLYSKQGLTRILETLDRDSASRSVKSFLKQSDKYLSTIDAVVRFLQGGDPTLAYRFANETFLPQGPRFSVLNELSSPTEDGLTIAFGTLGIQDRAQYLASLYIDDLNDVIRDGIDANFEIAKYAEKLAASAPSFDPLLNSLNGTPTLVDSFLDEITARLMEKHAPAIVGITIPFPGNVYGAFRIAKEVKRLSPHTKISFGGGYVNTELRELSDPRVFDYVDYITLDDGEGPFLSLLDHLKDASAPLFRTFIRENGKVVLKTNPQAHDIPFRDSGVPTYDGLPLKKYLSLCELLNPMHRLWTDGRWNKLTLAHGCYWKKCTFCDTTLDYINRYEPKSAQQIVDKMESLIAETGQSGFHFVDEAAPPALLSAMAQEIIRRGLTVSWWGNIRFEKSFTPEMISVLAQSGCVAVSGGLEVASDRLLSLMEKGVSVEQVARVTHAFTEAGIMVHSYLMYGFPTQTVQETIDSLERVRQLFQMGCLQSAFWHRFSATAHSPVGKNPEKYKIKIHPVESMFSKNDLTFEDETGIDHGVFHPGLKKAIYNYMHGMGLEEDVRFWFDFPVPKTRVNKNLVRSAIKQKPQSRTSP